MLKYDMVVTPQLIYITEGADYSWANRVVAEIPEKPIIPICVGMASKVNKRNFQMDDGLLKTLKIISERCELIGVRGEYSASVLGKYGIKNTQIIGCPSIYYPILRRGMKDIIRSREPIRVVTNSISLGDYPLEKSWFKYIAEKDYPFIHQGIIDKSLYCAYLKKNLRYFMDIAEWEAYVRTFTFSIGARLHGNILPLWIGIPSFFFTHDSRTREICEFFKLPHMEICKFDPRKSIEYYYELADYSEFNKAIPNLLVRYESFLKANNLEANKRVGIGQGQ